MTDCPLCGAERIAGELVCRSCLEQPDWLERYYAQISQHVIETAPQLSGSIQTVAVKPKPGERCPTCGQKVRKPGMSAAERQRRYRERKREKENGRKSKRRNPS